MSGRFKSLAAKKQFSVTFITPHQGSTSGGVYAIHQLATHLSATMLVSLVVQGGNVQANTGVRTYKSPSLAAEEIPDADTIVLHADSYDGEQFANLPVSKGKRFLYFQGYGTPGNKTVIENLKRGFMVIASARWLAGEALQYGSRSIYVPYGLDYSIFFPGRPEERKDNMVSMMTHHLDWKGTADGLKALSKVREIRPDTEIYLFGVNQPDFQAEFILKPSRELVASLLRKSTVFVCASWEEGFGMPGLEALACGTTLATTDTKGSRDYAFNCETALVTPPNNQNC